MMEQKQIVNLWDLHKNLCLIPALIAIETEGNKIPNVACIEVAGKLVSVAAFIEQLKASSKVVSRGTASQGVPAQAGNNVKELVEKFKTYLLPESNLRHHFLPYSNRSKAMVKNIP